MLAWGSNTNVSFALPPRLLDAQPWQFARLVFVYPILEEYIFRGWLQPAFDRHLGRRVLPLVTVSNIVVSMLFALAHLIYHPPVMALATFFPSLVFGHLRDRYRHIAPCVALHVYYNAGYFSLFT